MTADNLPKGKVPKLERWDLTEKYVSCRFDGIFLLHFLRKIQIEGAKENGKIYVDTYKRK